MGKLVEKLHQVGQTTGNRFGFMGRAEAEAHPPRPAALLVALGAGDTATAEASIKAGADGFLITDWSPNSDIDRMKATFQPGGTLWGVEYAGASVAPEGVQKAAAEAGAGFLLIGPSAPAAVLFDEDQRLDLMVVVDIPRDDAALLLIRSENLLPAHAALIQLPSNPAALSKMTVNEFARLRWVFETVRFPTLVRLNEAVQAETIKALVHLGAEGIIVSGATGKPDVVAKQVQMIGETLQTLPVGESRRSSVAIGGFISGAGESLMPRRPGRPAPEPDEE